MTYTHAGAFAIGTRRIPTSGSADFLFSIELNHIACLITTESKTDRSLKPSLWHFPGSVLFVPDGFVSLTIAQPDFVIDSIRKADKNWRRPLTLEDHRQLCLEPEVIEVLNWCLLEHISYS